ncbi:MAG: SDR family oxidoreductase [Clostridiales bacterium]|nr:SDR family oxidoreductase [Clostridiales bacterium]
MKNRTCVILVAGASSGLGAGMVQGLVERGHIVYAGARSYREAQWPADRPGYRPCYLDVTREETVAALVERILEEEGRIDVLINAAAFFVTGAVEEISVEEFSRVLDTNFLGMIRTIQAVLPHMRARGCGKIINMSSMNGLLAIPFQGAYIASKFAVEGMTEALALEVRDYGIDCVLIEPGDHRSASDKYRLRAARADREDSPYYKRYIHAVTKIRQDENSGSRPDKLAQTLHTIILRRKPKLRYRIGGIGQTIAAPLKHVLPSRLFERVIAGMYFGGG